MPSVPASTHSSRAASRSPKSARRAAPDPARHGCRRARLAPPLGRVLQVLRSCRPGRDHRRHVETHPRPCGSDRRRARDPARRDAWVRELRALSVHVERAPDVLPRGPVRLAGSPRPGRRGKLNATARRLYDSFGPADASPIRSSAPGYNRADSGHGCHSRHALRSHFGGSDRLYAADARLVFGARLRQPVRVGSFSRRALPAVEEPFEPLATSPPSLRRPTRSATR